MALRGADKEVVTARNLQAAGRCSGVFALCCDGCCTGRSYECRLKTECDYYEFGSFCADYCLSSGRICESIEDQERCESYSDCKWSSSASGRTGAGGTLSAGSKAVISILVLLAVVGGGGGFLFDRYKKRQARESSEDRGIEAAINKTETNALGSLFDKATAFLGLSPIKPLHVDATETSRDKAGADEATDAIDGDVGIEVEEGKENIVR